MKQMTPTAVERAMKLQDVMLRAMAKRITWFQAAEILGSVVGRWAPGKRGLSTKAMKDCSIAGWECPRPSACHWTPWKKCCGCIRKSTLISTCSTQPGEIKVLFLI